MTTTSLVVGWLLVAQTGQSNPFSQRDPDNVPRKTAPAASIPDDNDAPPATRSRWADEPSTPPAARPATESRPSLFRNESPAANTGSEAPAWGARSTNTNTNNNTAAPRWPAQDDTSNNENNNSNPLRGRAVEQDPRATRETPARTTNNWETRPSTTPERNSSAGHFEGGLLLPLSKASSVSAGTELMTQALVPPRGAALNGRPVTLLEAVSRSGDRQQQLRTTRAYWRLAVAMADYYWAIDEKQIFGEVQPHKKPVDASALKTAAMSATARVHEAELQVRAAQQDLSDLIRPANFENQPLAHDVPFIGQYRTYFEQLFAERDPPGRTRLIDHNLPVRRDLVEARAKAVQSANDTVEALVDAYRKNDCDTHELLSNLIELRRERRDFLTAVRDYNYDIAEYATSVATNNTSHQTLVSMMIRVSRPAAQSATQPNPNNSFQRNESPSSIRRSSFEEEDRLPPEPRRLPAVQPPARNLRQPDSADEVNIDREGRGVNAQGKKLFSVMVKPHEQPARTAGFEQEEAPVVERRAPAAQLYPANSHTTPRDDLTDAPPFTPLR